MEVISMSILSLYYVQASYRNCLSNFLILLTPRKGRQANRDASSQKWPLWPLTNLYQFSLYHLSKQQITRRLDEKIAEQALSLSYQLTPYGFPSNNCLTTINHYSATFASPSKLSKNRIQPQLSTYFVCRQPAFQ